MSAPISVWSARARFARTLSLLGILSALLLSGCAAVPAPGATAARFVASPTPLSTPTPTPTPTPVADPVSAAPDFWGGAGCADLVSEDTLTAMFGAPLPLVDQPSQAYWPGGAALAEEGWLYCSWDAGDGRTFEWAVWPHAEQAVTEEISDPTGFYKEHGEDFALSCYETDCSANYAIDGNWVFLRLAGLKSGTAHDAVDLAAEATRTTLTGFAWGPGWTVPADTTAVPGECSGVDPEHRMGELWGEDGVEAKRSDSGFDIPSGPAAWRAAGLLRCSWFGADQSASVSVVIAPGANWATTSPVMAYGQTFEQAEIPVGADSAYWTCRPDGSCTLNVVAGGNWLQIDWSSEGSGRDEAARAAEVLLSSLEPA